MPVDSEHEKYAGIVSRAAKVRDFVSGDVRGYIKRLPGHDDATYAKYQERAYYLPALPRTIDAFVGMIMSPTPVVQGHPSGFQSYLDDLTYDGEPFARVTSRVVEEVMTAARCVVVVDYPEGSENEQLTKAQAEAKGLRAYARVYSADDLIDWRVSSRGGERYISQMRLQESYDVPTEDEWVTDTETQIRVLEYDEGVYRVRIFRKQEAGDWALFSESVPLANGKPLTAIPAVVFGPDSLDPSRIVAPPVLELADIAESHLGDSADRQWALAWCGAPTLVLVGYNTEDGAVSLGSSAGIALGEGGSAELLTMSADAVGALKDSMEDKRRDMAAVGARLLMDESSTQIAMETAVIQRAGEHSVLAGVANTTADGMKKVLQYLAAWAGLEMDISVSLNTDFVPLRLSPDEMRADIEAVQSGHLSTRDLFDKWKERGVIRPDKTFEDHQLEVEEDSNRIADEDLGTSEEDED